MLSSYNTNLKKHVRQRVRGSDQSWLNRGSNALVPFWGTLKRQQGQSTVISGPQESTEDNECIKDRGLGRFLGASGPTKDPQPIRRSLVGASWARIQSLCWLPWLPFGAATASNALTYDVAIVSDAIINPKMLAGLNKPANWLTVRQQHLCPYPYPSQFSSST